MLALKKISIKKLAIYFSIIILMLGGIGFALYQNQRLTSRSSSAIDDPARAEAKPGQPSETNKVKNNQGIDLTIFSSEKFKELKENILILQENSGLGKRDPFKPN